MKRLLVLLCLALSCIGFSQDHQWSIAAYWDARTKTTNAVVLRRIGIVEKPFGLKFDLEVDGFAGSDMDSNLLAGVSIGKTFPVAQNADFKFGLGVSTQQNKPSGIGLILGLAWRF